MTDLFVKKSNAELEAMEDCTMVCMRVMAEKPLILPDNLTGVCCECGWKVQFHPTAPKLKNKICVECAMDLLPLDSVSEIHMSEEQLAVLKQHLQKKT